MASLREIVFDCDNPPALARFWARALEGYAVRAYDDAEISRLAALGRTPETDPVVMIDGPGPTLCFQEWPIEYRGRNRVRLDLICADRKTEIARLLALGATVRDEHDGYCVLLDPEGNAFCLQSSN